MQKSNTLMVEVVYNKHTATATVVHNAGLCSHYTGEGQQASDGYH